MPNARLAVLLVSIPIALEACSSSSPDERVEQTAAPLRVSSSSLVCPWVGKDIGGATPMHFAAPASLQPGLDLVGTDLGGWYFHGGRYYVSFGDAVRSAWRASDDAHAVVESFDPCPKISFVTTAGATPGTLTPAPYDLRFGTASSYSSYALGANEGAAGFSDGPNALAAIGVHRYCWLGCAAGDTCDSATNVCVAPATEGAYPRALMLWAHFDGTPSDSSVLWADDFFQIQLWQSSAARAVPSFSPNAPFAGRYRGMPDRPDGDAATQPKLFMWGRPAFASTVQQPTYLAYFDLNEPLATRWKKPMVFTGLDASGNPTWRYTDPAQTTSPVAVPILAASSETIDGAPILVNGLMNVTWIPELGVWMMLYGGRPPEPRGTTAFQNDPRYGFYYRTAPHPWGPWTAPARFWDARSAHFYDPGQPMYSSATNPTMHNAGEWPGTTTAGEYGASILPPLTEHHVTFVRVRWAMSVFNPYRIFVMQTDIAR